MSQAEILLGNLWLGDCFGWARLEWSGRGWAFIGAEDGRLSSFLVAIDSYIQVDDERVEVKLPSRLSSKENCHPALLWREARGCQGKKV